ncbi:MAG: cation transporter [Butyricicoccus sp.]
MTNALIHIFIRDAENTGDSRVREKFGVLSGAVGLACNLFLFALKLIIGLLTGSISIAADAFNNLSDGLSCLISIVGFRFPAGAGCEASVRLRTHRYITD